MRVIVRSSPIHAAGVFAIDPIPKGTRVLEYTGERMKHEAADALYDHRPYTYLFGFGDGSHVIDGYGLAMYVNHSCDPNCETEEDDQRHVWISAMRDIAAGEELTYDYFLYDGDGDAPCTCGHANCRGTMYSPAEIRKRKRKEAAEKRKQEGSGGRPKSSKRKSSA